MSEEGREPGGNEEGVSRSDPTLPLFMNPAFENQLMAGMGDQPLARPGQQAAAPPPPQYEQREQPAEHDDDNRQAPPARAPGAKPARDAGPFRHPNEDDDGEPGGEPATAAESQAGTPPGLDLAAVALAVGGLQTQQKQIADVLESTGRAVGSIADRMASAPAPEAKPKPLPPRVVALAERFQVDPDDLHAALRDVAGEEVAEFAAALDRNVRAAQASQQAFLVGMKKADPGFDKVAFDNYVMAVPTAAAAFASTSDKLAAGVLIWQLAKSAPAPSGAHVPEPASQERRPVSGAGRAQPVAAGGTGSRAQALSPEEWRDKETERLREATADLGDNHPMAGDFFMQRLFGGYKPGHFAAPRGGQGGRRSG